MPTRVVALNRAIAVAETQGPAAALDLVDAVAAELDGYHPTGGGNEQSGPANCD